MEWLPKLPREPALDAVLALLDGPGEAGDLVVFVRDLAALESGQDDCLAPEPRSDRVALYRPLFQGILAEHEIGGEQLAMLLFQEIRVKQEFPRLALSLSRWERLLL